MKLYVMLKNIQTITYEWTLDKLYVEADETFWELCAVGRCARAVVNHVRPHRLRMMCGWEMCTCCHQPRPPTPIEDEARVVQCPNSASWEVLIGIPICGNTCDELLCIDEADGGQIQ